MPPDVRAPSRCAALDPVGVFDSGVGGLSVACELMRQLPNRPIVYLADQANAPYGQRSMAEICCLARGITRFLLDQGACAIVMACNTASAAALHPLRAEMPGVPFVGMEPAVKPATERTRRGHVGVIATQATFQGQLFASLLDRYAAGVTVHQEVCPDLVPLVEAGEVNSDRTKQVVAGYLAPLLEAGIDQLVLGCTHYPFLRPLIEEVVGPDVEIIDPAPAVARQTRRIVEGLEKTAQEAVSPHHLFYTTGDPRRFRRLLQLLLNMEADVQQARWVETDRLVASKFQTT
jgi:glutamate racemase